jgi:hypothetical protein
MMSIQTQLNDYLRSAGPFPQAWSAQGSHLQCTLRAASVDSLACSLDEIVCQPLEGSSWSAQQMRNFADRICQQVNYLMEPLQVVEFDSSSSALQARSTTPTRQDDMRSYFELALSASSATLRRYSTRPGQPRQRSPMVITCEVLTRLLADLDRLAEAL